MNLRKHYFKILILITTMSILACNSEKKDNSQNPLNFKFNETVDFKNLTVQNVKDASANIIEKCNTALKNIINVKENEKTFDNTMLALDDMMFELGNIMSTLELLSSVHPDSAIRNETMKYSEELSKYATEISLNEDLYRAIKKYSQSEEAKKLDGFKLRYTTKTVEEFERNGFALPKEKRDELQIVQNKISELGIKFSNNIDSYDDSLIVSEADMDGLPDDYKASHKVSEGKYKIDLSYPSYIPFMKYSKSEKARKELSFKYKNRAKDSNLVVLKQMIEQRHKKAQILGYPSFATYELGDRMAKTPKTVWDFENRLAEKVKAKAKLDLEELLVIKRKMTGNAQEKVINEWESGYYNNILLIEKYQLDNQKLKEYFEVNNVINGMFEVANKLFGISFIEVKNASVWHEDVILYELQREGKSFARVYFDLYPRPNKYGHAAVFHMIGGKNTKEGYQMPTAAMVCNFPKATADQPALLPHSDVETFFHEFGHVLHNTMTVSELSSQAGTAVARDFVELPSQLMENWAWNYDALKLYAKHYKTGEVLPKEMYDKMVAAKNVGSGLFALQQIFYGSLDMTYYDQFDPTKNETTTDVAKRLQNNITLYPYREGTHMEASFGHLDGYAAGYYGYMWARVFSEDIASIFNKDGIFNAELGKKYLETILSKGGSEEEMEMLKKFLGREPNEDGFLKYLGL